MTSKSQLPTTQTDFLFRLGGICGLSMALLYVIFSQGPRLTQMWLRDLSADRKENTMNHMMVLKASAQSDTSHFPHLAVTEPSLMAMPDFKKGPISDPPSVKNPQGENSAYFVWNNKSAVVPQHELELCVWREEGGVSVLRQNIQKHKKERGGEGVRRGKRDRGMWRTPSR